MTNEEPVFGPAVPERQEAPERELQAEPERQEPPKREPRAEPKPLEIPQIGIWGTVAAGKTTLLAMLYLHATKEKAGFEFLVAPGQPGEIQRETVKFCIEAERMIRTGKFMEKTETEREIVYQVRQLSRGWRGGSRLSLLRMTDRPGEQYEWSENEGTDKDEALRNLAQCKCLLCLLDVERLIGARLRPKSYFDDFLGMFSRFMNEAPEDEEGYLDQYVALCLSKADLCWDYYSLNRYSAEQVYNDLVDTPTRNQIAKYVHPDRMKVFMCSTVGTILDEHGRARPNVKKVEKNGEVKYIARPGDDIEPYGIFEPLKWLFDRLYTS